jgi:hypothetical protein
MKPSKKHRPGKSAEEQWRDIFASWVVSGLSDTDFCKRENYSIDAFRYWRRRLEEPDRGSLARPKKRTKFQVRSDASKQRWIRDDKKEAFWRRHIEAWKRSGLSTRAYCKSKNLTESSFNAWCREIELRDREKVATTNATALLEEIEQQMPNPFVPLRLISREPKCEQVESLPARLEEAKPNVSILVPGGAVITVSGCSAGFITELYLSLRCEVQP